MKISKTIRTGGAVTFGVVAAVTAGVVLEPSGAAFAKTNGVAVVGKVETPLGLQGTRGAGAHVQIIFNLVDPSRKKTDVQVAYGWDKNGDGKITEDEYAIATEDRLDPADTRRNKAPQLFTTAGDIGAAQSFIWNSTADLPSNRIVTLEYQLTPQGRPVPDPNNPGSFLFAVGPGNTPVFAGVKVRVRALQAHGTGKRAAKTYGDWAYSDPFDVNNNNPPTMTIDSVEGNGISVPTASDEIVKVHWTVFDKDSEDLNGDGILEIPQGEDLNGDGILEPERVGVAFDYHRVAANENPAAMSPTQLAALTWSPCTRAVGVGDTDSLLAQPGVPIPTSGDLAGLPSAPPGVGRHWTFAWNSLVDVGTAYAKYVFRATPFDEKRERGVVSYFQTPIQLDNLKVFNPGSAAFPIASLTAPRVGHTVTRVQGTVNATDVLDRGDDNSLNGFQSVLVAGGSLSVGGGGVTDIDLMSVNTTTAETTTSARIHLLLNTGRAFHTATALDDGRVLFVGGVDSTGLNRLTSTEVYDPKTKTVVPGPSISTARSNHAAVKLASGDVAVFGGAGTGGAPLASCEIIHVLPYSDVGGVPIDPATWTVEALPSLSVAQQSPTATLLPDQTVLVTGGFDGSGAAVQTAQLLNPLNPGVNPATPQVKAPVFIDVPPMIEARKYGTATSLLDGDVLFAGGANKTSLEVFNWQTRAFEPVVGAALTTPRAQHVATLLGDGSVLLAGGTSDPGAATPPLTATADVFKIGAHGVGSWAGSLLNVNGVMADGRRLAKGAVIDNGRVFLVGGLDATGVTASVETYTPQYGVNFAPAARTSLPSSQQSWLFGAPTYYRLTDSEQDHAKVQLQFIDRSATGDHVWHACSPQPNTIGGDLAETTADLATALTDDLSLAIDPVAHNTPGDHAYIWAVSLDVPRPAMGQQIGPFNVRTIPYGAIRGTPGESIPLSVLYNTRVVPTVLPFENYADNRPDLGKPAGTVTPIQGGDIPIWVHLRDLDGGMPHTTGDLANCLFEYAVDTNGDGQIKSQDNEGFKTCTASGAAVGHPSSSNPQTGLTTYFDAYTDSDPGFGARPASKGWTVFKWDSVHDLGAPVSSFANVFIRVTPSDADVGFDRTIHNIQGQPNVLTIVRNPDMLYLASWAPRYSYLKTSMPTNDPIDFTFNGQIDTTSVNASTIQIYRGTGTSSAIRGSFAVLNNADNTATVTFYPDPQSLNAGSPVYAQTAASTVFFPNDDYSFRIAGYDPAVNPDPQSGVATQVKPLNQSVAGGQYSTYRLVFAPPVNVNGTDANYKVHTAAAGVYADDGGAVTNTLQSPAPLPAPGTILRNQGLSGSPITFTFSRALDVSTVLSPNIKATLTAPVKKAGVVQAGVSSVVAGRWSVTNTQTSLGTSVTSQAVVSFTPVFQMPPNSTLQFSWSAGLKAFNGHSVPNGTFQYSVESYSTTANTNVILESFANQNQKDTTITTAVWGTDGCVPGALTGGTSGISVGSPPVGGSDLTVTNGQTVTLTLATNDYGNITVNKGGTLVIASASGPCTIRATGNVTISGTMTFKGQDGAHGVHGDAYTGYYPYTFIGYGYAVGSSYPYFGGTRAGGVGKNGGGSGGSSVSASSSETTARVAGSNGVAATGTSTTYGHGGAVASETSSATYYRCYYGVGGGAGGGNAFSGMIGGRDTANSSYPVSSGYGTTSTPGSAFNDAFLTSGMTGGGGGGGGATTWYYPGYSYYGVLQGGAGGAGAGAVTIYCNGVFNLSATGLIDGRGGNGGESSHFCGSGGAGAGGSLRVVALGGATSAPSKFDGVIDLRGGRGGSKGFANLDSPYYYSNAASDHPARFGGDGSPGRFVGIAPNFASPDEMRVYGQMMLRQVVSLPTQTSVPSASVPPVGYNGQAVFNGAQSTTFYNYGTTPVLHWSALNIVSGSVVDLVGTVPVRIFVDGSATIAGTLRINGNSTTALASGASTGTPGQLIQNFSNDGLSAQTTFPNGQTYYYPYVGLDSYYSGMLGNGGGGQGGSGVGGTNGSGFEGTDGTGPAPGKHNFLSSSGYNSDLMSGDSGGTGGANATDGEDGWASYAVNAAYNYLGAWSDTVGAGMISTSGAATTATNFTGTPNFPKRLGLATVDPTSLTVGDSSNLGSFEGSGGGGGNAGGSRSYDYGGMAGLGGGGGGAIAIVSPTVTISGEIDARGGDGQAPGAAYYWYPGYNYAHSGGGGGSGGTVYVAGNTVSITPANSSGSGGATFDLRGGMGGGWRGQNQYAGIMNYPEYMSTGAFGGNGGYGRLVVDYVSTLNSGHFLDDHWGMEQPSGIDTASNTYKTLAGTARFYCPGLVSGGTAARSKWYDLKSFSPALTAFSMATQQNASSISFRLEGAQSLPNSLGSAAGTWGSNYTANTGDPDTGNTTGLFTASGNPILQGYRFVRWDLTFLRSTGATGAPVVFDNVTATYTTDGP